MFCFARLGRNDGPQRRHGIVACRMVTTRAQMFAQTNAAEFTASKACARQVRVRAPSAAAEYTASTARARQVRVVRAHSAAAVHTSSEALANSRPGWCVLQAEPTQQARRGVEKQLVAVPWHVVLRSS